MDINGISKIYPENSRKFRCGYVRLLIESLVAMHIWSIYVQTKGNNTGGLKHYLFCLYELYQKRKKQERRAKSTHHISPSSLERLPNHEQNKLKSMTCLQRITTGLT